MNALILNVEFWKAIASFAWPAVAVFVFLLFRPAILSVLKRENMTLKVGSLELSVQEAAKINGKDIADLQQKMAELEARLLENKTGEAGGPTPQADLFVAPSEPGKLLWVDDFPSNNAFLVEKLKERGIEVVLSLSTADALDRIQFDDFAAVITDLGRIENGSNNPYAGMDLIKKLRSKGHTQPVLVYAGRRGFSNREKLIAAGAEGVSTSGVEVMSFVERHIG